MAPPCRRSLRLSYFWLINKRSASNSQTAPLAKTNAEYKYLQRLKPDSPPNSRILKVALMGMSNAGKSSLINALVGRRVSSVSKTFHTTQRNTVALLIEGPTQVVLLDTPGIFANTSSAKRDVDKRLRTDPFAAVAQADVVAVLVDVGNVWTRGSLHKEIVDTLMRYQQKPSVLILNKVDLVASKAELLTVTRTLTGGVIAGAATADAVVGFLRRQRNTRSSAYFEELFARYDAKMARATPEQVAKLPAGIDGSAVADRSGSWKRFSRVFMVSSLQSCDGVGDLRDFLCKQAKPGPWQFHSSLVTDQRPDEIVEQCLREAFLEHLPQEIPFRLGTEISEWEDRGGTLTVSVSVLCPNKGTFSITMGSGGSTLRTIAVKAERDLIETFGCPVMLKLILKNASSKT